MIRRKLRYCRHKIFDPEHRDVIYNPFFALFSGENSFGKAENGRGRETSEGVGGEGAKGSSSRGAPRTGDETDRRGASHGNGARANGSESQRGEAEGERGSNLSSGK